MLQGYLSDLSDLSVKAGEAFTAHVRSGTAARLSVVRLRHGDPNPVGPGFLSEPQDWPGTAQNLAASAPPSAIGSHLYLPGALPVGSDLTLALCLQPTLLSDDEQVVCSWAADGLRTSLAIDRDGLLVLRCGDDVAGRNRERLHPRRWYFVGVTIGALMDLMNGYDASYADALHGHWDLSRCKDLDLVVDVSGPGRGGFAVNGPARAVLGRVPAVGPELFTEGDSDYDAVHLHTDDVDDVGWPCAPLRRGG